MSILALQYASAETGRSQVAELPVAPPDFRNGSFEKPAVGGGIEARIPEGWYMLGSSTPKIYGKGQGGGAKDGDQFVVVDSDQLKQNFPAQAGNLRYSFYVKSMLSGGTTLRSTVGDSVKTTRVEPNKWTPITGEFHSSGGTQAVLLGAVGPVAIDNLKIEYVPVVTGTPSAVEPMEYGESRTVTYDVTQDGGAPGRGALFTVPLPKGVDFDKDKVKIDRIVDGKEVPQSVKDVKEINHSLVAPIGSAGDGELKAGDHYRISYPIHFGSKSDAAGLNGKFELKPDLTLDGKKIPLTGVNVDIATADLQFLEDSGFNANSYVVGDKADLVTHVKNAGKFAAKDVVIKVARPTEISESSFAAEADGQACVPDQNRTGLECKIAKIDPQGDVSVTFSGTVGAVSADGSLKAQAALSSRTIDVKPGENSRLFESKATRKVDLEVKADILKDGSPVGNSVKPGEKVSLSVTATNHGPASPAQVDVEVSLPKNVVPDEEVPGYKDGIWSVGKLPAGESATLKIPVTVPADESRMDLGTKIGWSSGEEFDETNPSNNTSSRGVQVERNAKLNVQVSVVPPAGGAPQEYVPGDHVTYKIAVKNDGPSKASKVQITHAMPTGMVPGTWTGPTGTSYEDGVWTIPGIASEDTAELTVKGVVPADEEKTVHRVCVVGADIPDPRGDYKTTCDDKNDISGHIATSELNVVQRAAALLTVSPDGGTGSLPLPGQKVSWTVKTANPGVSKARGLEFEVPVPAGVGDAEAAPGENGGTYEGGLWKPADVPGNGQAVLKMTGTVLPDHDKLDYRATVKASTTQLDGSKGSKVGDSVEKSVDVQQVAGLDVSIAALDGKDTVKVGEQAKVKVTVANKEGPSTARNTVVEVGLPTVNGLTHDGGANFNGEPGGEGYGTWKVGDLKAGEEKSLTLSFTPEEAKEFPFDVLAARSDAANPEECQDICASTRVKATADKPDDPSKPDDQTPPPGDGQQPPADDGGKGDDGGQSLVDQVLASTGSNALWWGGGALGAAGIGAALLIAARRRR
ncbi:CARDB domain-containing protein [Streptomyces sp. NBC_01264]|uniref:CARDB domain-containing protein n=1 Tax=Streptomyces sp. NBC_01264 TaxID=2903804 RepID=UPI002257796B|nr:CARDB domain-containing protein [Streptomyces sp. NBC_01264]MCX4784436.1 DUF11 domain-containing protein [Streptomyces sp. NBC_01264]